MGLGGKNVGGASRSELGRCVMVRRRQRRTQGREHVLSYERTSTSLLTEQGSGRFHLFCHSAFEIRGPRPRTKVIFSAKQWCPSWDRSCSMGQSREKF